MKTEVEFIPVDSSSLINDVCRLAGEIWREYFTSVIGSAQVEYMLKNFQSFSAIKNQIEKEGYKYFIMTSGNDCIGYTSVRSENNAMHLSKLYIRKDMRGRGISRKAIEFIKNICHQEKLGKIWLNVNKNNTASIEIYKKLGFEIEKTKITEIGNGFVMDDYIMELPLIYDMMLECAEHARENAYAPYSHFRVGAAIMAENGDIYVGCNIENSSYPLCMCAERTALYKAISEGVKKFSMIAISGGVDDTCEECFPCGSCRQVLSEFCDKNLKIVLRDGKKIRVYTLEELMPHSFKLKK